MRNLGFEAIIERLCFGLALSITFPPPFILETTALHRVPQTPLERERVLLRVRQEIADKSPSFAVDRGMLESLAKTLLRELESSEDFVPWTMVLFGSEIWKKRIIAIPPTRRTLLLPHCMRNSVQCPAAYDAEGLHCQTCGHCELAGLKHHAESLGYSVLIAEGTPVVMKSILSGKTDAILGVGCLKSLERAFEKLQLVGIPAAAVPLLDANCKDSTVDISWVRELIDIPYIPYNTQSLRNQQSSSGVVDSGGGEDSPPTWLHLLRQAATLADEVLPEPNSATAQQTFLEATERAAREFLVSGGKYYRPFITLAAFDALTGSRGLRFDGAEHVKTFPNIVKRTALAMEVFHKASLIHDDIEDDDPFRYGQPTAHKRYGIPTAINLGDYLIGLGYRLISAESPGLRQESGAVKADILAKLSDAHTKLCEGQGAELFWRSGQSSQIAPADALKIYGLKTSPAFEAALYAGVRLGVFFRGEKTESDEIFLQKLAEPIARFARFWGIAFQIKNDLDDWTPETGNKSIEARDVREGRPTILWAFALESLALPDRERLLNLDAVLRSNRTAANAERVPDEKIVEQIRGLYEKANVFEKARLLAEKYTKRAEEEANKIAHQPLQNFLRHLQRR